MASPTNLPGEDKAWELLASMQREEVCRRAKVSFDEALRSYRVQTFGMDFDVSVDARTIGSSNPKSALLLGRLGYFFRLSLLWYLASAKDIEETGRLVKLETVTGGEIFTRGSHVLPLEALAKKYGKDREGFAARGAQLGAVRAQQGDLSLRLLPLPRIPVVLALWLEDDEFPARADLLFDSTCQLQAPMDILWSVAMMTVLVMMEDGKTGAGTETKQ